MLLISTRKGLFEAERTGAGFEVTRGHFIGDNVSLALADPRGGWYAALAWFVPAIKDEKRTTIDGKLVVTRTRDGGKTFEPLTRGLPPRAYDLVYRHAFARTPDGTLAFGSTTGNVFASTDGGDAWSVVSNYLPPVYAITST